MSEPLFQIAWQYAEHDEGGYSNNPNDRGGETYRGISRVNNPTWAGWPIIDATTHGLDFDAVLASDDALQSLVVEFYRSRYWPFAATNVPQELASKFVDHAINEEGSGTKGAAVLSLQIALECKPDGDLGPGTISAMQSANVENLRQRWTAELAKHYAAICRANPSQWEFWDGWVGRACRWPVG